MVGSPEDEDFERKFRVGSERVERVPSAQEPARSTQSPALRTTAERVQRRAAPTAGSDVLPERLQAGVEALSGLPMGDVNVHYNSPRPALHRALAYAQGTDIHLGPGQERHLPHEAWHVVQQAQGRVRASVQAKGRTDINTDRSLEREADIMGARALRHGERGGPAIGVTSRSGRSILARTIQLKAPAGWDNGDRSTWEPDFYNGFSYTLVSDALSTLDLNTERETANKWATMALNNGLVGIGPVRSTYKSSYDQAADAFSVSQNVTGLDKLVVHAHISPTNVVALDGGVNLKWAHDETGYKAANVPSAIGSSIIDVATARKHWETNPAHDQAEKDAQDAEDLAVGEAIFNLFDTSKDEAIKAAALEKAKKDSETELVNWAWKATIKKKEFGQKLAEAKLDPVKYEKFLQMLRSVKARKEKEAAQAAPP